MRHIIVIIILTGVIASLTSITGNIVSSTLPEAWKPYLWIAWPLFIAFTVAGIGLGIWRVSAQKQADTSKENRQQRTRDKKVQASIQEHKRVYRVLGVPIWSVSDYQENREYRLLGIPVWVWLSHSPSLPATTLAAITLGLAVGSGILVYSEFSSPSSPAITATSNAPTTTIESTDNVTLASPTEGEVVACEYLAKGTFILSNNEFVWPIVRVGGRYYPQGLGGQNPSMTNGRWSANIRFGNCANLDADKGTRFELLIVTANEDVNQKFKDYLQQEVNGYYGGMQTLPTDTKIYEHISVTRQ
jgi:hypothetical protein